MIKEQYDINFITDYFMDNHNAILKHYANDWSDDDSIEYLIVDYIVNGYNYDGVLMYSLYKENQYLDDDDMDDALKLYIMFLDEEQLTLNYDALLNYVENRM